MVKTKKQRGVSLLTLIITVFVIIILAMITMNVNNMSINEATSVKFKQELTDVKRGVETVKLINAKEGTDEKTLNQNFKKVEVENPPENFVSFDDEKITGYVVDLEKIDYKKLKTGQGYINVNEGDTVTFAVDDVFVYDKIGTIYYAKGTYLENDELHYTTDDSTKVTGPKVTVENTEGGKIVIKVEPTNGGEITSVKVGTSEATKVTDGVYEIEVEKNGTYVVSATEKDNGTTRVNVKVTKLEGGSDSEENINAPTTGIILVNGGEIYTNNSKGTITIETDAEYIYTKHVTDGEIPTEPSTTSSGWRKAVETQTIWLSEGKNDVYVWFKNGGNDTIISDSKSIMLDTIAPTRTKPTVEIFDGYSFRVTSNQKDATSGIKRIEIGYKIVGEDEYTWIEAPDINNPTIEILDNIPDVNYQIITRAEDNSGLSSESIDYMTGKLDPVPDGVTITYYPREGYTAKSEVTIKYPSEAENDIFEKWYRLDGGEWQVADEMEIILAIDENIKIDAVVVANIKDEIIFGDIASVTINNIDETEPVIGKVYYDSINTENGANFKASVEIIDSETGIVAYQITKEDIQPTVWEELDPKAKSVTATFDANVGETY